MIIAGLQSNVILASPMPVTDYFLMCSAERPGKPDAAAAVRTTGSTRVSGADKRAALVSGDKRGPSSSGLAAMWNKAPAKKSRKEAGSSDASGRRLAAASVADANDAVRLAQVQNACTYQRSLEQSCIPSESRSAHKRKQCAFARLHVQSAHAEQTAFQQQVRAQIILVHLWL